MFIILMSVNFYRNREHDVGNHFVPQFLSCSIMSVEISTDVSTVGGNSHSNFVPDCKMSLEISTDIFSQSQDVTGNFHRHFSLTAKMSMEISSDVFLLPVK